MELKEFRVRLTRWGLNTGIRIPKQVVRKYQFSDGEEVLISPSKKGFEVKKIRQLEPIDNYAI